MSRRGLYQDIIKEATGAPDEDLEAIEMSMRDDIFHSTLDWLTRKQLEKGARKAWKLVKILRAKTLTMEEMDAHQAGTGHSHYLRLEKDQHVCEDCL